MAGDRGGVRARRPSTFSRTATDTAEETRRVGTGGGGGGHGHDIGETACGRWWKGRWPQASPPSMGRSTRLRGRHKHDEGEEDAGEGRSLTRQPNKAIINQT